MLMCTLKSTVAFFFLFFTLDLAFLFLSLAYYFPTAAGGANVALNTAGGVFGILAAFAAWYNALAGLLEPTNSFFLVRSLSLCVVGPTQLTKNLRSQLHTSRGPPRVVSREERRPSAMSSDTMPRSRRPSKLEVLKQCRGKLITVVVRRRYLVW